MWNPSRLHQIWGAIHNQFRDPANNYRKLTPGVAGIGLIIPDQLHELHIRNYRQPPTEIRHNYTADDTTGDPVTALRLPRDIDIRRLESSEGGSNWQDDGGGRRNPTGGSIATWFKINPRVC